MIVIKIFQYIIPIFTIVKIIKKYQIFYNLLGIITAKKHLFMEKNTNIYLYKPAFHKINLTIFNL